MTPEQVIDLALPAVIGVAGLRLVHDWRMQPAEPGKPVLPPKGKPGPLDSFLHPLREPIRVGNTRVDFYETHMRMLAMSGGYKTTLLAELVRQRIEAGRSVVVLTGGDSDQLEAEIRAHGGWVMRPHQSPLRFNPFEGEPTYMAQTWATFFPTTSKAMVYHSAFELAALAYFRSTTQYSVRGLKEFVLTYEPPPPADPKAAEHSKMLWKGMKEGYGALRLELMDQFLGEWIGQELSIDYCMRHKIPLMFIIDSVDDPDLVRLSASLVWGSICYSVHKTGGIDAFVDEFGRLPAGLVSNQVRTWRRNKSHLIAASHTDRDFDPILEDLFHINCLGRMVASATDTRKAASDMTWGAVHPTGFGAHALGHRRSRLNDIKRDPREGYFWLVDLARVQEVKVREYRPLSKPWPRHSVRGFLLREHPNAVSGMAGGLGGGYAATDKGKVLAQNRAAGPAPVSPGENGGVLRTEAEKEAEQEAEALAYQQGPPEQPAWSKLNAHTQALWLAHVFPYGALDERACWHIDRALKGKGKRPGVQFKAAKGEPPKDWQAYDLIKALDEAEKQGFLYDEARLGAFLAYVKLHLKTRDLSGDHVCERWRGTEAKLCVRAAHIEWEDRLINSDLHWDRLAERKEQVA